MDDEKISKIPALKVMMKQCNCNSKMYAVIMMKEKDVAEHKQDQ